MTFELDHGLLFFIFFLNDLLSAAFERLMKLHGNFDTGAPTACMQHVGNNGLSGDDCTYILYSTFTCSWGRGK